MLKYFIFFISFQLLSESPPKTLPRKTINIYVKAKEKKKPKVDEIIAETPPAIVPLESQDIAPPIKNFKLSANLHIPSIEITGNLNSFAIAHDSKPFPSFQALAEIDPTTGKIFLQSTDPEKIKKWFLYIVPSFEENISTAPKNIIAEGIKIESPFSWNFKNTKGYDISPGFYFYRFVVMYQNQIQAWSSLKILDYRSNAAKKPFEMRFVPHIYKNDVIVPHNDNGNFKLKLDSTETAKLAMIDRSGRKIVYPVSPIGITFSNLPNMESVPTAPFQFKLKGKTDTGNSVFYNFKTVPVLNSQFEIDLEIKKGTSSHVITATNGIFETRYNLQVTLQ